MLKYEHMTPIYSLASSAAKDLLSEIEAHSLKASITLERSLYSTDSSYPIVSSIPKTWTVLGEWASLVADQDLELPALSFHSAQSLV